MNKVAIPAILVALTACGGAEVPAREPERAHSEERPKRPALQMKSELGSVDAGAVKAAFHALEGKFVECQKGGLQRVEVLSGNVKFFIRIAEDGSVRWAYLEDSDVGDRATEKCLVDAAMGARGWPKPEGGEAEVRYGMELSLQSRPPNEWGADKVAHALSKERGALESCKGGAGSYRATMYVGPGGRVLSAGVASTDKDDPAKADCLVNVLVRLKGLPSPGSWPAKVSLAL